jgi:hypothetical protein
MTGEVGAQRFRLAIAGLDLAIHLKEAKKDGCAAQASDATPFFDRLCPRMTK